MSTSDVHQGQKVQRLSLVGPAIPQDLIRETSLSSLSLGHIRNSGEKKHPTPLGS